MHNSFQAVNYETQFIFYQNLETLDDIKILNNFSPNFFTAVIFYGNLELKGLKAAFDELKKQNYIVIIASTFEKALSLGAHGLHIESDFKTIKAIKQKYPDLLLGCGNIATKHLAMEIAENGADYLFFGRLSDKMHMPSNNLDLCEWWIQTMRTPAIVQSENNLEHIKILSKIKPEFIAIDNNLIKTFDKNFSIGYIEDKLKSALMDS